MTLRFIEGFEVSKSITELGRKWDFITSSGTGLTFVTGRFFGSALKIPTGAQMNLDKDIPSASVVVQGVAVKIKAPVDGMVLFRAITSGSTEALLEIITSGVTAGKFKLQFEVGGPSGYTHLSAQEFDLETWHTIEWKLQIGFSGGYEVRVNGVVTHSATGVLVGKNATNINRVSIGGNHTDYVYLDDFYVLDGVGTVRNGFLGTVSIKGVVPDADGTLADWVGAYTDVDEDPVDDDTSYIATDVLNEQQSFGFPTISGINDNILGVQFIVDAKTSAAMSSAKLKPVMRISGTVYLGAEFDVGTSYDEDVVVVELSPVASAQWSLAEINAAEFGVKLSAFA